MPTKDPATLKLQWYLALMALTLFILILGVSVGFGGVIMMEESQGNRLKQLGGIICIALGVVLGFVGFISLLLCSIDFTTECQRYIDRLNPTD